MKKNLKLNAKSIKLKAKSIKNKKNVGKLSSIQTSIVLLPAIIFAIFLVGIVCFFIAWGAFQKQFPPPPATLTYQQYNNDKQTKPVGWKKYTNEKYGFTLYYPAQGYLQDKSCLTKRVCKDVIYGVCGNGIKSEQWTKSTSFIQLDNMLGIIINDYNGPIDTFIKSQGGNPANFELKTEKVKGADEAIYATLNNKDGMTPPIPSILTPAYIIKKGNYVYQIAPLQNFGSADGCLPPVGTKANVFDSAYWNIPQSISFD